MNCTPTRDGTLVPRTPPPDLTLGQVGARVKDRREAVGYLKAAQHTQDAAERCALRRRAAELLVPQR